ncbi:hypothetical protein RCL1_001291 [Eukaryota sp. TZLM3-RCL]
MSALENQLFQLRFAAKQMNKNATKAEKEQKSERLKVKKALEKGNTEGARIYAQNVIRKKSEQMNFLRLASRLDAVASRLQGAIQVGSVTKTMGKVVGSLDRALNDMNLEKVSHVMNEFEKTFENLEIRSEFLNESLGSSVASATPENEVDALITEVGAEHMLDVSHALKVPASSVPNAPTATTTSPDDDLLARFQTLKS